MDEQLLKMKILIEERNKLASGIVDDELSSLRAEVLDLEQRLDKAFREPNASELAAQLEAQLAQRRELVACRDRLRAIATIEREEEEKSRLEDTESRLIEELSSLRMEYESIVSSIEESL